MGSDLRFDGRVAIITGAGNGLGRAHALLLGSRGAKVVVNDLGGSAQGGGKSSAAADKVVAEIKAQGGEAIANYDSVEDGDKIVKSAIDAWGRVDIVVNNAGILRDTSFPKMTAEDWDLIYRVHVLGAFRVTHAAWPYMRDAGFGRVVMTASAAGIYGNFGQANYSMAKMGLVGLASTLALEGRKKNVLVNTIAPIAGSRLTETVMPKELTDALKPELVTPLVAYLCHESSAETGGLFEVGGGFFAKLRWERAKGKTFKLGRAVTPDALAQSWDAITSFAESTHPADITQSMAPILANLQAGPSKGGSELIDVDAALGYEWPAVTTSYDEKDLALYALGVGAGGDPLDKGDLQLVYEQHGDGFRALPTFGVIPALEVMMRLAREGKHAPGLTYGFDRVLHGEQYTEIKRPLPPHAKLTHKMRVKDIFDKGKGAIVITETRSFDESGEEIVRNEVTTFVRGAGGWGGDRGPQTEQHVPPAREPDKVITEKIGPSQALLYRLTGDWNPLHVDPEFAKNFGFERPILHGLCTFGYAARHVIRAFCNNDPRLFKSIKVRFSDSVFPGETLTTSMWKEADGRVVFQCRVVERDKVVISNAAIELFAEIPQPKAARPAPSAALPAATSAAPATPTTTGPSSQDVFAAIRDYVEKNPELAPKTQAVFVFKLSNPESAWTIDLKTGKGAVTPGAAATSDATLELADADFMQMTTGAADPQKLYFGGKLKIKGNVMASQKLDFLKKIDPAAAKAAVAESKTAAAAAAAPAKTASAPTASTTTAAANAPAVFAALGQRIAKSSALVAEVAAIVRVNVKGPDATYVVDLASGAGSVKAGDTKEATVTLTIADEDLLSLAKGTESPQALYQHGKLRVDGDVRVAHKLGFFKGLV